MTEVEPRGPEPVLQPEDTDKDSDTSLLNRSQAAKKVLATQVQGTVKWFNVRNGYGFINRNDTKEDVFVHQTAIKRNNPRKFLRSVGDGETVEFDVVEGEKGAEAANVTGPGGVPVKGSRFAPNRRRFRRRPFRSRADMSGSGGEGGSAEPMSEGERTEDTSPQERPRRRPPPPFFFRRRFGRGQRLPAQQQDAENKDPGALEVQPSGDDQQRPPPRRFRPRWRRPFRPRPPPTQTSEGETSIDGNAKPPTNGTPRPEPQRQRTRPFFQRRRRQRGAPGQAAGQGEGNDSGEPSHSSPSEDAPKPSGSPAEAGKSQAEASSPPPAVTADAPASE